MPAELPAIEGLDLAASCVTSSRAGGDYYDVLPLPGGRWGFFLADVSGHGGITLGSEMGERRSGCAGGAHPAIETHPS